MPTYDYECANGHRYEVLQRITEEPHRTCTKIVSDGKKVRPCGAPCHRVIHPAGISLKGEGWYRDGYQKKSKD